MDDMIHDAEVPDGQLERCYNESTCILVLRAWRVKERNEHRVFARA
jgi:hypothetical protein